MWFKIKLQTNPKEPIISMNDPKNYNTHNIRNKL